MIPRRVRLAVLIAFVCHGIFILSGRYHLSYDAYTHMLFANHYAESWFSLWETRWYTGFTVVSYPPLTHQLIAVFVPFLGLDRAFALVLWFVTTLYPLGVYAFSRIFTGRTSASYAALGSALLLPIYVTAHIFGQLPFLTSTLAALFAAASLNRYLRDGGLHNFALSTALITTSIAMHHATLMVQPFFIFAVAANNLLGEKFPFAYISLLLRRLLFFCVFSIITSLLVIFPFWQWGAAQTLQTSIDHLSRHNFLSDPVALAIFFFPLYGPLIVLIPFLIRKWPARWIGLLLSFTILFLFGLGGTTPLPRLFLGSAWEWLTYDRFAFWACLTLTPFLGIFLISLKRRWRNRFRTRPIHTLLQRAFVPILVFFLLAFTALGSWFTPLFFPFQPGSIEMEPIEKFLNNGINSQWRYLTFGFGDQFARLNLLTRATTIDGSYHTARTLPELRESGVGQVDTAYWAVDGMAAIRPILQKSGEYSVRWGFVNPGTREAVETRLGTVFRSPFVPLLDELGWKRVRILENGILVYENPDTVPLVAQPSPAFPALASFSWGVLPMLALIAATALGALRLYPIQAEWVIRKVYLLAIGLLPITLCFWIYRTVGEFPHARVYFTYDHALFFLSDALVILAVLLWLVVKIARGTNMIRAALRGIRLAFLLPIVSRSRNNLEKPEYGGAGVHPHPRIRGSFRHWPAFREVLIVFIFLTTLSVLWSRDWRTSLYISLHLWLILLLILSLADWHEVWGVAMFGLCCALCIELVAGLSTFGLQSTSFLETLQLKWPGEITPALPGASVVQLADGSRILRAYGTMPHPNILGGLVLITLLGPAGLFLTGKKTNYPALILVTLGILLLILTFSRSAWLGLIVFSVVLGLKARYFERRELVLLFSAILLTVLGSFYALRDLVVTRTVNPGVVTEKISAAGRFWLDDQALQMIEHSPVAGAGIGSFLLKLAETAVDGAPIEPVHNLFLLLTAELGLAGMILVLGICVSIARQISISRSQHVILAGALLTGLGVIGLFDHYLLTLAPGRIMLGLVLGLWAGQVASHA